MAGETGPDTPGPAGTDGKAQSANGKMTKKPVSVTELELQFAQNPESNAYIDLCEAYLDQGRFMEAMVVCKKGIKAHPDSIEAKVLLARVYSRQKKYKRALTELDELAAQKDKEPAVFLARAKVREESGDEQGAVADLKKAVDLDRSFQEAIDLLQAKGIQYPTASAPPPPPPAPEPVKQRPSQVQVRGFTPAKTPQAPISQKPEPAWPTGDTNDLGSDDIINRKSKPPPMPAAMRAASFSRVDPAVQHAPQR